MVILPFIIGNAWVSYADAVKLRNDIRATLTSHFGALGSRLSLDFCVGQLGWIRRSLLT
jgi:hypothetical protein